MKKLISTLLSIALLSTTGCGTYNGSGSIEYRNGFLTYERGKKTVIDLSDTGIIHRIIGKKDYAEPSSVEKGEIGPDRIAIINSYIPTQKDIKIFNGVVNNSQKRQLAQIERE